MSTLKDLINILYKFDPFDKKIDEKLNSFNPSSCDGFVNNAGQNHKCDIVDWRPSGQTICYLWFFLCCSLCEENPIN